MANKKYLYYRPHLFDFLKYLFDHYRVAIWTSQMKHNAWETIRQILSEEQIAKLEFLWSRQECLLYPDYSSKKPIDRVFQTFPHFDKHNTVIVDDSVDKMTNLDNFVHIKPFLLPREDDQELLVLLDKLRQRFSWP